MSALEIFAPAKLNLFLAITGRRADGFHELVSVATTLAFGDTLRAEVMPGAAGAERLRWRAMIRRCPWMRLIWF